MSFNSFKRRGASKEAGRAGVPNYEGRQDGVVGDGSMEFYTIDAQEVKLLNKAGSEAEEESGEIPEIETVGEEMNGCSSVIRSEEYAILSDSTDELEEFLLYRGERNVGVEREFRSNDERIDEWCLAHVSRSTSGVAFCSGNKRVKEIASSWGVEDEDSEETVRRNAPSCEAPAPLFATERLAGLTKSEIRQIAKFVKDLLPYLLRERALVRPARLPGKYKKIPSLFPETTLIPKCSLDAGNLSPVTSLYFKMKEILLASPVEPKVEQLEDISISSTSSSLPAMSWYGWHMVPQFQDTEY